MAKPLLPDDLSAEMRVGAAAREIINVKVDELRRFVAPAMEGEFDGVHDLRVAVKRLREALRLFRRLIRRRRRRHAIAMAQELNDALGAVREPDVLMRDARRIAEALPEGAEALRGLIDEWSGQRKRAMLELRGVWKRLEDAQFLDQTRRAARAARRRSSPLNDLPLERFAYTAISARAEAAMGALDQARHCDDAHLLHLLRIAVKKLRYTIEPFAPVFPRLDDACELVSDLQESLGLTHDHDVLLAALESYVGRAHPADSGAARAALDLVRDRRAEHYEHARADIERFDAAAWHHRLLDAID